MPTENRSSNTEQMVSVPRDLIELALAHLPSDSAAGFELRDLLAQPAALHHEEPVAWLDIVSGNTFDNAEAIEVAGRKAFPLRSHPPTSDGFSAEQMAVQGADGYRNGIKAAAELAEAYPELAQAIRALPLPQ